MKNYYSNGKLLITGEYVVLDGAKSLAIPTKFGQSLIVETINEPIISWKSFNDDGTVWFEDTFHLNTLTLEDDTSIHEISKRIIQILNASKTLNPAFLTSEKGYKISTSLTFPRNWGLGTSSTLINNVAQWAHINPFELLKLTFGGSGYDIACAQNNAPILYQIIENKSCINQVDFNPEFKNHLYFVYLNKKQNSRDGIATYYSHKQNVSSVISEINDITTKIINCKTLGEFDFLITHHEQIISNCIKQKTVKEHLFHDFNGSIKSLGAWGGDFILATLTENPTKYFKQKGFKTVLSYGEMVL